MKDLLEKYKSGSWYPRCYRKPEQKPEPSRELLCLGEENV